MKKTPFLTLILLLSLIPLGQSASAAQVQTGTDVNSYNQVIDHNFYAAGGTVLLDNEFEKDIVVAGGEVTLKGKVKGDALIFGGHSNIEGEIEGDLRVIGGEIVLTGKVLGDLVIFGGRVDLNEGAEILGETILVGGEIFQNVSLLNNVKVVAGKFNVNGELGSSTEVTTQRIILDQNSNVSGNLRYYAPQSAEEISGSEITGTVTFNEIKTIRETGIVKSTIINLLSFWIILRFITTLIIAFILIQIFRVFTQGVSEISIHSFLKSLLFGFLSLFVVPFVVIILFISLIAIPVGFLVLLSYIFVFTIAPAISGIVVGTLVHNMFKEQVDNRVTFQNAAIGIVFLTVLQFVPFIGDLTRFIFTLVAVGAIGRYIFRRIVK